MQFLWKSTKEPKEGDVFTFLMPTGTYLFGRVIADHLESPRTPIPGAHLTYIYDVQSVDKVPPVRDLVPSRLLIPPFYIYKEPWVDGLFETVEHRPLGSGDVLEQHCFWRPTQKKYLDGAGQVLEQRVEPCGRWGLLAYTWVDDLVSEALGIPLVPDPKRK